MVTSATGRKAMRRKDKSPVRVAVGIRAGASPNHPSKTHKRVRSSHLGYDCYQTGLVNGSGKIRCVLRPGRTPAHIPTDIRVLLPTEMWWPERDHEMAHGMVDAVLTFDLSAMGAWRATWPEHEFGYEHFMELAERRLAAVRESNIPATPQLPPRLDGEAQPGRPVTISVQGSAGMPRQLGLFPGVPVDVEPHSKADFDGYCVHTALVRFDDGNSALRVDVGALLLDGSKLLCSRAYVDLVDNRFEIVRHYPGRLRAVRLPPTLIYTVLGVRAPGAPKRTEAEPHRGQPMRSRAATESRKMQAVMSQGDPDAEHVPEPVVHPEPVEVAGNARFEAQRARIHEDPDGGRFEKFPDAPGHPTT